MVHIDIICSNNRVKIRNYAWSSLPFSGTNITIGVCEITFDCDFGMRAASNSLRVDRSNLSGVELTYSAEVPCKVLTTTLKGTPSEHAEFKTRFLISNRSVALPSGLQRCAGPRPPTGAAKKYSKRVELGDRKTILGYS